MTPTNQDENNIIFHRAFYCTLSRYNRQQQILRELLEITAEDTTLDSLTFKLRQKFSTNNDVKYPILKALTSVAFNQLESSDLFARQQPDNDNQVEVSSNTSSDEE